MKRKTTKQKKLSTGGLLEAGGSAAGQALIPIPGVGAAIGGLAGKFLGGLFGGKPKEPPTPVTVTGIASSGNQYLAQGGMLNMNKVPGVAHKIVGPRHEQGGVPLANGQEVEGGETLHRKMVFSDRVRVPGQSITFSKAHERLMKRGGNEESVNKLFNLQQKVTGNRSGSKQMAEGGFLEQIAPYAGDILNIGRGLFSSTDVQEPTKIDRSHIAALPTRVDVSADQAQARSATRAITGNPNASVNSKLAAHSNFLVNSHRIQQDKTNRENDLKTQVALQEGQANLIDSRYENQARQERYQTDAIRGNLITEGVAGLARTYQGTKAMENQMNSDALGFAASLTQLPPERIQSFVDSIRQFLPPHLQNIDFSNPEEVSSLPPDILEQLKQPFSYFMARG